LACKSSNIASSLKLKQKLNSSRATSWPGVRFVYTKPADSPVLMIAGITWTATNTAHEAILCCKSSARQN
jgi:hypothetical protein